MRITIFFLVLFTLFLPFLNTAKADQQTVVSVLISNADYPNQNAKDIGLGQFGKYTPDQKLKSDPLDLASSVNYGRFATANGIVVDKDLVLVPYHVIEDATKIYVRTDSAGSYANIYAADARSDLAILKLIDPVPNLKPAKIASSFEPVFGENVSVVNSIGAELPKNTKSKILAIDQKIASNSTEQKGFGGVTPPQPLLTYSTLIKLDGQMGVSGGGVFNRNNELIGITTSLSTSQEAEESQRLVVPVDQLYKPIIEQLIKGLEVEYGFLGISWDSPFGFRGGRGGFRFQQPVFEPPADGGVVIGMVTPGMPAEAKGLMTGDILVAVNGKKVNSPQEMQFRIAAALADRDTVLTIRRQSRGHENVVVRLVKTNNPLPWIASQNPKPVFGINVDHHSTLLQDLVQKERDQGILGGIPKGVVVRSIEKGSPAEAVFNELNRRYVITHVDGIQVSNPSDFYETAKGKDSIKIRFNRIGVSNKSFEMTLP